MLRNVKTVVVYGSKEVEYYSEIFPKYQEKFKFIHYGLDYENNDSYQGKLPEKFFFSGEEVIVIMKRLLKPLKNLTIPYLV